MYANIKKKFGQNFLVDKNIIKNICKLIDINFDKNILEIGPGTGNLTEFIIEKKPNKLTLIEIDRELANKLIEKYKSYNFVKIINEDVLSSSHIANNKFDLIISNLPYNISSQILVKLATVLNKPNKMILMFQKEFSDKLLERKLNSINSLINCFYSIKKKFNVSKNSFFPVPKVLSTVLEFNLLKNNLIKESEIINYFEFRKLIFNKKRKMLKNILKNYNINKIEVLKSRAENLSLNQFISIFREINF